MRKSIFLFCFNLIFCFNLFSQGLGLGIGPSFWVDNKVLNDITTSNFHPKDLINKNLDPGFNVNARVKFFIMKSIY